MRARNITWTLPAYKHAVLRAIKSENHDQNKPLNTKIHLQTDRCQQEQNYRVVSQLVSVSMMDQINKIITHEIQQWATWLPIAQLFSPQISFKPPKFSNLTGFYMKNNVTLGMKLVGHRLTRNTKDEMHIKSLFLKAQWSQGRPQSKQHRLQNFPYACKPTGRS